MALSGNYFNKSNLEDSYLKLSFVSSKLDTDGITLLGLFYLEVFPNQITRELNRTAYITSWITCIITNDATALQDGYDAMKSMPEYNMFKDV